MNFDWTDLTQNERAKVDKVLNGLKELRVSSIEEWFLKSPESLEWSHKSRVTEIILRGLGNVHYRKRRVGAVSAMLSIDKCYIAELYIKLQFRSLGEMRKKFPGILGISMNNFQSSAQSEINKRVATEYGDITNEEISEFIKNNDISYLHELSRVDYVNILSVRDEFRKKIGKELFLKRHNRKARLKYAESKRLFHAEYGHLNVETLQQYILKRNIKTKIEIFRENPYLYGVIFTAKTKYYLLHLLSTCWDSTYLDEPQDKRIQVSCIEICDSLLKIFRDKNVPGHMSIMSFDKNLGTILSGKGWYWIAKAYLLINFNLLRSRKSDYIFDWDKEKTSKFINTLGFTKESNLSSEIREFIEMKGVEL
jgi:hypothetical protein